MNAYCKASLFSVLLILLLVINNKISMVIATDTDMIINEKSENAIDSEAETNDSNNNSNNNFDTVNKETDDTETDYTETDDTETDNTEPDNMKPDDLNNTEMEDDKEPESDLIPSDKPEDNIDYGDEVINDEETTDITGNNIIIEQDQSGENEQEQGTSGEETGGNQVEETDVKLLNNNFIITNEHTTIVYNFDEFKAALDSENNYTNIYLGADIDMEAGGIAIHSDKKKVTICGINPENGLGPYTINELKSLAPGNSLRVESDSGTKEIVMRDINVIGRNFYGAVCAYDAVFDVVITFENINYNGPQLSYNRNGIVRITGNSQITITGENGESIGHELVEAEGLELGGNITIDHYSPLLSAVWLVGNSSYIKVLQGADVLWNETGTYMIYHDYLTPATFTIEEGSTLTLNTLNGIFYNADLLYHQFGDINIGSDAVFKIIQKAQNVSTIPIIKVNNSINISEGASLIIIAHNAPQLIQMTGAVDFKAERLKTLVLYNKNNELIRWNNINDRKISIVSTFLNYWKTPCDADILGSFTDSPLYRWRKKYGEELSVDVTVRNNVTRSVSSNYTADDYGSAPSTESLNIENARILTAGRMPLNIDPVMNTSTHITGETEPNAMIKAVYTDSDGVINTVYGHANSSGAFDIDIVKPPLLDSNVDIFSSVDYKCVLESTTVTNTPYNSLMFVHVPNHMKFPKTSISTKREQILREDADWHIIIGDSRTLGAQWELYARLALPLSTTKNNIEHFVENAVIFTDSGGHKTVLGDAAIKVASGSKTASNESIVGWPDNEGIMLDVNTVEVLSNTNYSAKIEWILVDGP